MPITDYHAKYFAFELTKRCPSNSLEKLSATLSNAQVDLNPHQIEAALFAFRSPLSKGAILADEVGLGKTIEAGLVLSQKWAERKKKMLLIVPSSLRKQWNAELQEKFFLPSIIMEAKSFNQFIKNGNLNPFEQDDVIIICSYHFAKAKAPYLKKIEWDLVVMDEAHRLRNVYKPSNKIAKEIKNALLEVPKILLTATPLQNSLLELYGLVSIIDDHVFGDVKSFKANYARVSREQDINESELGLVEPAQEKFADLRNRLKPVCTRTLRRQVLERIKFTKRIPITQDYIPTEDEIALYDGMSEFLQRPRLFTLPSSQRQLITLILRKLLASSSFAIASTLDGLVYKLEKLIEEAKRQQATRENGVPGLEDNYEGLEELSDEWVDDEEEDEKESGAKQTAYTEKDVELMKAEQADLKKFYELAKKIWKNSKGEALIIALKKGFETTAELGAKKKAIIFTESTVTQNYLLKLLSESGYADKIVLFNGSNNDEKSKQIYTAWIKTNKDTDKITGSKSADTRAAIIEHFRDEAEIMIGTEAAAEGVNLQFCSLLINYDLPWNPQRIEQRIGRCHRYGQKHDVVVINFVNRKNAADQRVYDLLDQKFNLFKGVFGASDEVLGSIESGIDFEKRIASIYQSCRTAEEINSAFDALQKEMEGDIQDGLKDARQKLLENFDSEVHEKLKVNLKESQAYLDTYENWLWETTRHFLGESAAFSGDEYAFKLKNNPFPGEAIDPGPYKIGKNIVEAHVYRPGHPLAQRILEAVKTKDTGEVEIIFDYSNHPVKVSVLKEFVGKRGVLKISNYTVEAFEQEDTLVVTAFNDANESIEPEIAKKFFALSGKIDQAIITSGEKAKLEVAEAELVQLTSSRIAERNSEFFDSEVDKLDKWAEDRKKALEIELKKLDIDIKTAKTNAKKIVLLEEKLKIQREIKEKEKKRNEMRKELYNAQDEVDQKKEDLIGKVEAQLKQKSSLTPLFTIRFRVV
ncbi:MAG: DEAD/DEAH box helicase family protein [Nitrospinae bacterium]|nr:DEAD/DEAH box helicase family protein [Nitrospinota bacterium]